MKLALFQRYLREQEIDLAVLTSSDSNLTYFTRTRPSGAILALTPKEAIFYLSQLDARPRVQGIKIKELKKNWPQQLSGFKTKKLGINEENLTFRQVEKLKKTFPRAKLVDLSAKLKELRMHKSPEELKNIAKACRISSKAYSSLLDNFSGFNTEKEIAFFLEKKICDLGAEPAFPTIVASGSNSSIPHHCASSAKLRRGFLQLDFGARYNNYCSDMSRVLYLGTPAKKELELYRFLLDSQERVIDLISAGRAFYSLDQASRKLLGKYSSYFIHSLGHGLGLDVHEWPSFRQEDQHQVQAGQVFTIEPGIYFPGKYGLRIEDTLFFASGAKILTPAGKELIILKKP